MLSRVNPLPDAGETRHLSSARTRVTAEALTYPYQSLHRLDQLLRVVTDVVFENNLDLLDVENVCGGISFHYSSQPVCWRLIKPMRASTERYLA
jgi:hypothetical protein